MNIQQFWSDVFAQRADEIRNTSTPMPAKRGNSSILDGLTRRGKQEDTSRKALKTLGKRQKYCLSTVSRPPAALLSSASAKRSLLQALTSVGACSFWRAAFWHVSRLPRKRRAKRHNPGALPKAASPPAALLSSASAELYILQALQAPVEAGACFFRGGRQARLRNRKF